MSFPLKKCPVNLRNMMLQHFGRPGSPSLPTILKVGTDRGSTELTALSLSKGRTEESRTTTCFVGDLSSSVDRWS